MDAKENIINKLYDKLDMYQKLKNTIGYNEELLTKPEGLSDELYKTKVIDKLPKLSERRLFNNAYLNTCIKQIKKKIESLES